MQTATVCVEDQELNPLIQEACPVYNKEVEIMLHANDSSTLHEQPVRLFG